MPKLPTAEDVKKARKQAAEAMTEALEQARTPLYAVLGAGDLATEAVRDYVAKARTEAGGQAKDVQTRVNELQVKLAELQDRLVEVRSQVRTQVRTRVNELPEDVAELRGKLDAGELRQALENYVQSLQDLYDRLATRGESTVDKLRQQPQVKRAIDRVEDVADTTEDRVGKFVEDARELTYEVLGRVSRRTRTAGEQAAQTTEKVADEVASAVEEAGDDVAAATRNATGATAGATGKAAGRTQPAKTTARTTTTRKNTTTRKAGTKA